jgi:hypothetical protein
MKGMPPPPGPFRCSDGRMIAIAPWTYSTIGGPFRSAVELRSAAGKVLASIDVDVTREEFRRVNHFDTLLNLMLARFETAIHELADRHGIRLVDP